MIEHSQYGKNNKPEGGNRELGLREFRLNSVSEFMKSSPGKCKLSKELKKREEVNYV